MLLPSGAAAHFVSECQRSLAGAEMGQDLLAERCQKSRLTALHVVQKQPVESHIRVSAQPVEMLLRAARDANALCHVCRRKMRGRFIESARQIEFRQLVLRQCRLAPERRALRGHWPV